MRSAATVDRMVRAGCMALGVALTASALAACGGGSSGVDASSKDAPIKIMVTETLSSPTMAFPQSGSGARAAAAAINANGGIDGHKVEVLTCNDQLDPNKAASCVQKGIDEHVVAFEGVLNLFTATLWPKLEAANIPFIGLDGNSSDQTTNKLSYPLTSGVEGVYFEAGRLATDHGGDKVALILPKVEQSAFVGEFAQQGIEAAGGTVSAKVSIDLGAPDMSTAGGQIVSAGAQGAVCICNPGDAAKVLKAARQQGWKGAFVTSNSAIYDSDLTSLGNLSDNLWMVANMRDASDPKASEWVSEMKKYEPKAELDAVSGSTWAGTHIIADLLKGRDTMTPATLVDALNSAPNLDMRGLSGDLSFKSDGPFDGAPRITNTNVLTFQAVDGKRKQLSTEFVDALTGK